MPLERSDIEASLKRKGFVEEDRRHRFSTLVVGGQKAGITTMTSKGTGYRTLDDSLVGQMAKQLKLTKKQFVELVNCTMTFDEYVALLNEAGEL
ncbi:MAG TPA: hypothetical protein VH062_21555 [Polyangiaceae bacterium]|nr:hypothetical protein [Polyangiaceae bacterium]